MKKYLLSILFAMFGIITYAQNEPAITLTAKVEGKPLTRISSNLLGIGI